MLSRQQARSSHAEGSSAATPRYRKIHDTLRAQIVSGAWPAGFKLPSELELARSFGCARMTIAKALGVLSERGLVSRRRRAGTVVSPPRPQESVLEIHDIESEVQAAGHEYRYECFERQIRGATTQDAAAVGVPLHTPLLAVRGLHRADGAAHALEERLINLAVVPDAKRQRFGPGSPGRWLLSRIPWSDAEHEISALNAAPRVAEKLGIARHSACLCIERRTWLGERRITYVKLIYPGSQHRLTARIRQSDGALAPRRSA